MNFENQIIFFFSALGVFNGFLLTIYFLYTARKRQFSNYFLALLVLMLSIRVIKSVFFYFNPKLSNIFIQIGLSACIMIGPLLFLYLKNYLNKEKVNWIIHTIPYLIFITILGTIYSYDQHQGGWSKWIVKGIYIQWLTYIILSLKFIKPSFKKFKSKGRLTDVDIWILSIYFGVVIIWLAYNIGAYTSYIIGALSFSFVLYLIILLIVFRNNKKTNFFNKKEKYIDKKIANEILRKIEIGLAKIVNNEVFLDPNITLQRMADELDVPKHILSQYLNEKLEKSFSTYINELRIEKIQKLLITENNYSIEGIAYECGFKTKSTFYSAFKKTVGVSPAEFRKEKFG